METQYRDRVPKPRIKYRQAGADTTLVGTKVSLEQAWALVGGYVEVIKLPGSPYTLLVNEEGRFRSMPINLKASVIAGQVIVGPCVALYGAARRGW